MDYENYSVMLYFKLGDISKTSPQYYNNLNPSPNIIVICCVSALLLVLVMTESF